MTDLASRLRERHSFLCDEAAEEIERLRGLLLAAIEGLEFKEPDFWLNTEPHVLRLTCEAVARQAKRAADQPSAARGPVWQFGTSVGINDHIEFCDGCHYSRVWIAEHGHGKGCPHRRRTARSRAADPTDAAP